MSRRRNIRDDESNISFWIAALIVGAVMIAAGMSNDDPGAMYCARNAHFCSGLIE